MLNLTNEFYNLIEKGYIYEEDENGMNMSYGELADVANELWVLVDEEVECYDSIIDQVEAYLKIINSADDDTAMFMGLDDELLGAYFYYDEDDGTIDYYGLPEYFIEKLNEYAIENDLKCVA